MLLHYTSEKTAEEIFPYLSDMQQFAGVHPVIYKAEFLEETTYRFYEQMHFLAIPFRFNYKVTIQNVKLNESVLMFSKVQPGVHLHLSFHLKKEKGKTLI